MGAGRVPVDRLPEQQLGRRLVAIPLALIVVITVVDIQSPPDVHLGPLLVVVPALTASLTGPRLTALVGVLAVAAQVLIGTLHDRLTTPERLSQTIALTVLSALVVIVCHVRERRSRELNRARSVAETAQLVLLRPPPRRIGPLRVAWRYLAAEDETRIGGDLFAIARSDRCTRVIIGDVRGKGLAAIGEASMVLGAFREGAHRYATLPELAAALEVSVCKNLEDVADTTQHDPGEHFVTAVLLDIPDHGSHAEMVNFGHPPPLVLHDHRVTALHARRPVPPLGVCELPAPGHHPDPFTFEDGDMLLLYTDGVIEARSPDGAFYPLTERAVSVPASGPEALIRGIHHDLLDHIGHEPEDDAVLLVIERYAAHHHRPHIRTRRPLNSRRRLDPGSQPATGGPS